MKLKDIAKINEWSEFAVVPLETMIPIPCYFTCLRIDRSKVPANLYVYSLRENDNGSQPASIEENVIVNHFGDIVLDHKLENLPIPLSLEEFQYDEEGNLIETE
jgi:hypothetical protein